MLRSCSSKKTVRPIFCATTSLRCSGRGAYSIRSLSSVPSWATADPRAMGVDTTPHAVKNLVDGNWAQNTAETISIPHPLDAGAPPIFTIPDTQISELGPFFESLRKVKKSGLHNPLKNPERYVQYGEISRKVSALCCVVLCCVVLCCVVFNLVESMKERRGAFCLFNFCFVSDQCFWFPAWLFLCSPNIFTFVLG